jgi:alkylation response protein AidB-like acyl-CoA dehydrogenase
VDLELSEEQDELRASVSRFLDDQAPVTPYVREMLTDPYGTTDTIWKGLADLGALGLLVAEDHGGSGMGMVEMGVVLEAAGRMVHPGPLLSTAVAAVSALDAVATDEEQAELLPGMAGGETVATLALFGPAGRSDWANPGVEATRTASGWRLDGEKSYVPDGAGADLLLVTATVAEGIGLFALDREAHGAEVAALETVDGTRKQTKVSLRGAPARRLGEGDATCHLGGVVDRVLAAYAADGVGTAERAMEIAVDYAKQRAQFDRPIGSFQAVQHLCSDMLQAVELARAGTGYALWALDATEPLEAHRAATMAKAFTADALPKVAMNAIQVLGGIGCTWEHDIHLYYKRLLTLQQIHGGPAAHLEDLASQIL